MGRPSSSRILVRAAPPVRVAHNLTHRVAAARLPDRLLNFQDGHPPLVDQPRRVVSHDCTTSTVGISSTLTTTSAVLSLLKLPVESEHNLNARLDQLQPQHVSPKNLWVTTQTATPTQAGCNAWS
jgi:hypothetical protein